MNWEKEFEKIKSKWWSLNSNKGYTKILRTISILEFDEFCEFIKGDFIPKEKVKSLLKQQREICADEYRDEENEDYLNERVLDLIRDAPEPKELKK